MVAGCSSTETRPGFVDGVSPVAVAKLEAAGKDPVPSRASDARSVDGYKRDAARHIYFRNATLLFDGAPPPILKSLVVLAIHADGNGTPTRVTVLRSNGYRDLEQRAIRSVRDAAPLPVPHAAVLDKGSIDYVETWLFRDDGRFQIRTLAEAQALVDD